MRAKTTSLPTTSQAASSASSDHTPSWCRTGFIQTLAAYPHLLPAPCCNGLGRKTRRLHSRMSSCFSPFLPKQRAETQPGGSDISIQVQPLQRATTTNSLSDLGTGRKHSKTAVINPPTLPRGPNKAQTPSSERRKREASSHSESTAC